jgi:hypothetical protein
LLRYCLQPVSENKNVKQEKYSVDIKRFIVGTLAGGVALFILGYVIWEILVADFYAANAGSATGVSKDPQVLWAVCVGTLAYAALITLAIGTRSESASVVDGVKIGAVVGFLLWLTVDMIFFGITNMSTITIAFVDPLLELVRAGVGGAVIAAVIGKMGS